MKKIISTAILVGTILLSACSSLDDSPEMTPSSNITEVPKVTMMAEPSPTALDVTATPDVIQDDNTEVRKNLEAMMPILDSLVRAMGIAGDTEYEPNDSDFFWRVMYLMGNNWGTTHPFVEPSEDGVTHVPTYVMEQFAGAAFATFAEFPTISENLQGSIWYDMENDEYVCTPSDMGGTVTELSDVLIAQDGGVTAIVGLYDGTYEPEDLVGHVSFTLEKYPYADGISNSIYLYSVTGATR